MNKNAHLIILIQRIINWNKQEHYYVIGKPIIKMKTNNIKNKNLWNTKFSSCIDLHATEHVVVMMFSLNVGGCPQDAWKTSS